MTKNIENQNTVYGFFPEIPGNSGRVAIDSDWLKENIAEYKRLNQPLEKCVADLSIVVGGDLYRWSSPEMEAKFHQDVTELFAQ